MEMAILQSHLENSNTLVLGDYTLPVTIFVWNVESLLGIQYTINTV